jgi:gentisate 1,2-dioxygenase
MDALDLPVLHYLDSSYAEEEELQNAPDSPDASQTRYRRSGLLPYDELGSQAAYPMLRYPWHDTRQALIDLAKTKAKDALVHLAYVNPVTGAECLPTLGHSAIMLRPGETARLTRKTAAAVIHVLEGSGESFIDGHTNTWDEHDITAIPTYADVEISNGSTSKPAFLFMVDDAPLQRKLGFYREFKPGDEL